MRKLNKRKLYSIINAAGLTSFGVGSSSIILSTIHENINTVGVIAGLGVATMGLSTHLVIHNLKYKNDNYIEELNSKKENSFYINGLLVEKDKLDRLELFLANYLYNSNNPNEKNILEDLFYDQLLIEKKLEFLSLEEDEIEDIIELHDYIEVLEDVEKSEEYSNLKKKFLLLDSSKKHNSVGNNSIVTSGDKIISLVKKID